MRLPCRKTIASWSLLALLITATTPLALAADDNENSTPTAWWLYTGQSYNDIIQKVQTLNARITDISPDNAAGNSFTVTYIRNTGAFAKQWWWYVGIDAATLEKNLAANKARLISLKAYDTGGGNIRFAVAMIANAGGDNKAWWYYYGKSTADITNLTKANNARLTAVQSYTANGQTLYTCIMIANTGADNKGWWWYFNETPQTIGNSVSTNKARLIDLTPSSTTSGRFNAVLEGCSGGCPGWWWYYGLDGADTLSKAEDNGARVMTAGRYQGCAAGECLVTTMISNTPADVTACDAQGCISEAKLATNICNTLAGHVVGYNCRVGAIRPIFGGLARTNTDAPSLPMAPDLVTNIASVSKTMTATAVIQLLAKKGITPDAKIGPYLYTDWQQGPNVNQLTFRELLTHTSGFGQLSVCGDNSKLDYADLKALVAGGVTASNIGKPQYGNCNFALMREIMPALSGQPLSGVPDGSQRAKQSIDQYLSYMNAHVYQPVGIPTRSCKPPGGSNELLSYPNPAGGAHGTDWGDWTDICGGGGWVLSTNDIFHVINDLATGNTLLSPTLRKQMISGSLGWDSAVRSDCPNPNVCKNGDLNNGPGTAAVWTYAGILKCNVPVVVSVNSPLPAPYQGGEDIIGLVKDALGKSSVPGAAKACP
jgi:hypothetical protein